MSGTTSVSGPGQGAPARPGAVIASLAAAGIVVSVMQTLVVPLLPKLPTLLHTSADGASWAITATLLAGAVATPVMGRLGDMFGKRRMLLISMTLMIAGSVVAALSDSLFPMIVGRTLQGGAAGAIPLGISIMRDELPPKRLGSAIGLMSASLGIGGALGLPAAAAIAEALNWHALFWVSGGLGALSVLVLLAFVSESPERSGGRFDLAGAVGLSAGLICLLLVVSKGSDWGWGSGTTLGLLAAAVLVLVLWGIWELRSAEPLVDLRTTIRRQVLLTNLASILIGFAMFAQSLILPQLLQLPTATGYGLGQSMLVAGLCMAPGGLMMMLVSPLSARISAAYGPKVSLMIGSTIIAFGYLLGIVLVHAAWQLIVVSVIIGTGIAVAYAALPALIMAAVPSTETAQANGLNTLMRSIGTSGSSAVLGMVLAHLTTRFGDAALPSLAGFRVGYALGAGAAVLGLLVAVFLPGIRRARTSGSGSPAESPRSAEHQPG